MEQDSLNPNDSAIWSIIEPKYYLGLISDEARWWYFEGHFWGGYEERLKFEQVELQHQAEIETLTDTINAYQLTLNGMRWQFTERGNRERF
jgi:hypothetical protein